MPHNKNHKQEIPWYWPEGVEYTGQDILDSELAGDEAINDPIEPVNVEAARLYGDKFDRQAAAMIEDRRKKDEAEDKRATKARSSKEYASAEADAASWFDNPEDVMTTYGEDYDLEDYDNVVDWEKIYLGDSDPDKGDSDSYKDMAKLVKARYGEEGWFGGWTAKEGFEGLEESDIDKLINDQVERKAKEQSVLKAENRKTYFKEQIKARANNPNFASESAIEELYKGYDYESLGPKEKAIADKVKTLKTLRDDSENPPTLESNTYLFNLQNEILEDVKSLYGDETEILVDYEGNSIKKLTPEKANSSFTFTEEEIKQYREQVQNGDWSAPTYEEHVNNVYNKKIHELAVNDFEGEERYDVVINDPEAWELLKEYKTGTADNGFVYNLPMEVLSKHYDRVIAADGDSAGGNSLITPEEQLAAKANRSGLSLSNFLEGNNFKSPLGYFGLLENDKKQDFSFIEKTFFDEDEFGDKDLSRNFKYKVRDHRDDRKQILLEKEVLKKMSLLNVNPTTEESSVDWLKRGGEMIVEGFKGDLAQWTGAAKIFEKFDEKDYEDVGTHGTFSKRKELDIIAGLEDTYGGLVSDEDKKKFERSVPYEIWEGFTGFVPALAEFALIDVAAKKTGIITGIPKLARRGAAAFRKAGITRGHNLNKTMNFLGHAMYEEAKMKAAFDEHYHMGGGVAFYGIGKALPFLKSSSPALNNLINNPVKGGVAGMLSVEGAKNLEALVSDIRGNKDFMTHIENEYYGGDIDSEFAFSKVGRDALVNYFVFGALGMRGMAKQGSRLQAGYKGFTGKNNPISATIASLTPVRTMKGKDGRVWWKGIEDIRNESYGLAQKASQKISYLEAKNVVDPTGKSPREPGIEKAKEEFKKWYTLYKNSEASLQQAWMMEDWQDDKKATEKVNKQFEGLKKTINPKGVEFFASKEAPEWVSDKNATAEINSTRDRIWINTNKAEPGKLPHELVHFGMKGMMKKNPEIALQLRNELSKVFDKNKIFDYKTGEELFIKDFIEDNYKLTKEQSEGLTKKEIKQREKEIQNEEYVAYVFEALANPRNYSRFVSSNKFNDLGKWSEGFMSKLGTDYKVNTKEDLINFFYSLSRGIAKGNVTQKQWDLFNNIDKQAWIKEPINTDMRTKESKSEDFAFESANSKEFTAMAAESVKIQNRFNELKEKHDGNIDKVIRELLVPDPKNPTSISKEFDAIIYNVINKYNQGRVFKGLEDQQVLDPTDRYMLATELVYDLTRGKNRGLESIIKTYDPAAYGKTEAEMPLTKHVMQQLAKRVYEIKEGSTDAGKSQGDVYQTVSFSQEGVLERAEAASADRSYTDFTSQIDKNQTKKSITIDGKKYKYPININEAMGIPDFAPVKTKEVIDNLSFKDLTFMGIGKELAPSVKEMMYSKIGINESTKPKDYVNIAKEWLLKNEQLGHEMIPRTSNPDMYENSMIGKTIFKNMFTKTGEVFKSSELPDWMSKETNARAEKWKKKDYKKGDLYRLVFGGRDNVANKKNFDEFLNQVAKVNSSQIGREAINNMAIQDLIQAKNPNKYHKLKLEQDVIPYVKEAIRGATDINLQSKEFKAKVKVEEAVWDKLVEKVGKYNWFGANIPKVWEEIRLSFTEKEKAILDKQWDKVIGVNGYKISGDAIKDMTARAEALRSLNQLNTGAIIPKSFSNKYAGINDAIIKLLRKEGVSEDDIKRLDINKTYKDRLNDSDFVEKYKEAIQDISKSLDPRVASIFQNSIGQGQFKFLGSDKVMTAVDRNEIFKDSKGNTDKLDFNPNHVKITDNGLFKKFVVSERSKYDLNSPVGRKKFAKVLENYLTPNVTKAQAKEGRKKASLAETEAANEKLQQYLYGKIFDYYKSSSDKISALNNIQFLLQIQTNIGQGFSRGLATHTSVTTQKTEKAYHSEHEFQVANFNGNFLLNMLNNAGNKAKFTSDFKKLSKIFKQSIITKELQGEADSPEMGGNTGFIKGYNTSLSAKANYMVDAIIQATTLDIKTGKTAKEITEDLVGVKQSLESINKIKSNLLKRLDKVVPGSAAQSKTLSNPEIIKKLNQIEEALMLAKMSKKAKGISVFDFDDTLAKSNSMVLYTLPNGKKGKINATEFAKQSEALEAKGAKFDFTEFNKVIDGKKGPLADLALKRQGKFGSKDIFVLTARPQASANAIHKFLKGIGLEIPLKNITGLENGSPQAKALWILDKASKGYNDFYFADDAYKNVKAVSDVLNVIDMKGEVQLALQSKDMSVKVNEMIERKFGIGKEKTYSRSKAAVMGKDSGKRKMMASSAQDFEGLLYRLLGKGKQGDADMQFFKDKLIKTFARGNNALSAQRMAMINDFKAMKKELIKAGIPKDLTKKVPGEPYTIEQALRVYTWKKQGMEVPDLSAADLKSLTDYVEKSPALKRFSQQLIDLNRGDGYMAPKKSWLAGTITTDLYENLNKVSRAKHLQEWQTNSDMIFSPENLNKMEAALGSNWRSAMENMLKRMKTGRNRNLMLSGKMGEMEGKALDWVNSSVGAIMFLNTRSAVLQTISTINYTNWHDNNPLMMAKAFANQKQYWKDYAELIMSDFMVERRGGNQINVNESEIADAAKESGVQGAISYLLNKGFVLTRAADSHAIASGGATFYRNRINTYKKKGFSEAEAKQKAFDEFREITEESQQSSRVDRISMQQASNIGRVVLAFANTPSQYARIMQRAASDLKNGRGDWRANVSKIAYYGMVQNFIFNALQSALFKDAFDEEEGIQSDTTMLASGMIGSILRGMGWQGAAIDTMKNMVLDLKKQSEKDRPKYADSALKLLDISPPVDSKVSKLRGAGKILDYDMDEIKSKSILDPTNPAYLAGGQVVSAFTNVPLDRAFIKYQNIADAMDEDNEMWKRIALSLGWQKWQLESDTGNVIEKFIKANFGKEAKFGEEQGFKKESSFKVKKK